MKANREAARRVRAEAAEVVRRLLHTDVTARELAAEYGLKSADPVLHVYARHTTPAQRRAAASRKNSGRNNPRHVPVGTLSVERVRGQAPRRMIKVRDGGTKDECWERYAAWLWRRDHGPVPPGHRVMHANGDTLDDRPENLVCVTRRQAIALVKANNPGAEAKRVDRVRRAMPLAGAAVRSANDLRRQRAAAAFAGEKASGIGRAELSRRTGIARWQLSRMSRGRMLMSAEQHAAVEVAIRDYGRERAGVETRGPQSPRQRAAARISNFLAGLEAAA